MAPRFKVELPGPGHAIIRFWKAGCRTTYADYGECGKIALTAYAPGRQRGYVEQWRGEGPLKFVVVTMVEVGERRKGYGTKLYEKAARLACKHFGVPLVSDTTGDRSTMAEGFWQKQLRKGRARKLHFIPDDPSGASPRRRVHTRYALRCPAPASLAGVHRRK